jgi:dTDP-4-dehydrorhamnose 3,5-epimerase
MNEPIVKNLKLFLDDRGYLAEILREDDSFFTKFGQLYLSTINPGAIKAFHIHRRKIDYLTCVEGQIKLAVFNEEGKKWEFHLSSMIPQIVIIPPNLWHGWMTVGTKSAILINVTTEAFNPEDKDEERMDPIKNKWNYIWEIKNG